MKFAVVVACLSVAFSAPIFGQSDNPRSRGFVPSYFSTPSADTPLRFTSHEQPLIPAPEYPQSHLSKGIEGALEVELFVTKEGEVVYAQVTVGSGDEEFDESALKSVMKARFPEGYATVNGIPSDFKVTVPFYFLLSSDPEQYWHTRLELARVQSTYEDVMREFQSYLSRRTAASKTKMQETRRRLESQVGLAKALHRKLAEKKETAILRLRDAIALSKDESVTPSERPDQRPIITGSGVRTVTTAYPHVSVATHTDSAGNEVQQLITELEIKKAYL